MDHYPGLTVLSLGAGVQSTTLALMSVEGILPRVDVAIFADTGWEPRAVYDHLDRLDATLTAAGIPLTRISNGNLRADTLNGPYLHLPVFVRGAGGDASMVRRQCTGDYKTDPIRRHVRELLGARRSKRGAVLTPPAGAVAEQWIGFSIEEVWRINDAHAPRYMRNRYPLIDLGMSRSNCQAWLARRGWQAVPKSACVVCPFHGNRMWRELRDNHPDEWAQAVADDEAIRARDYRGIKQPPYLHRSLLPLAQAPIDRPQPRRDSREDQGDLFDDLEFGDPDGCSPYGCRTGQAVA